MQLCFLTADSDAPDSQIKRSPPPRSPPTFDELATTIAGLAGIFTIAAVPHCSWTRRGTRCVRCDLQIHDIKTKSNYAKKHDVWSTTPSGGEHRQRGSGQQARAQSFTSRCTDEIQNVIAWSRAVMTRAVLSTAWARNLCVVVTLIALFAPPPIRAQKADAFCWKHWSFLRNMTPALPPQTIMLLEESFDTDSWNMSALALLQVSGIFASSVFVFTLCLQLCARHERRIR